MSSQGKQNVIFRQFPDGDIIALFPGIPWDRECRYITSYQHIGQHGAALPDLITELAIPDPENPEYLALIKEIESIYGNIDNLTRT